VKKHLKTSKKGTSSLEDGFLLKSLKKGGNKMDANQFAWAYLVMNGHANKRSSYYGGMEPVDHKAPGKVAVHWTDSWNDAFIKQIKTIGVNWKKTNAPASDSVSIFLGTFCKEQGHKEVIEGTLVLKNGTKQVWEAEALEVSNIFAVMADTTELQKFYAEVFGAE
jgi:hypothetical protein